MTVSRRWAMVITVHFTNSSFRVCCMRPSVTASTLAVASSSTMTRLFFIRARPRHNSCRSPTLKFSPPGVTGASRPSERRWTAGCRCTRFKTSHSSESSYSCHGSRLSRTVPENKVGSCGMIDRAFLRSSKPISDIFTPSMTIRPSLTSTSLNRAVRRELFPAPVLPTTPTLWPPWTVKLTLRSTKSNSGRYLIQTLSNDTVPWEGQPWGGHESGMRAGASVGILVYAARRSTLTSRFSVSAACLTPH
mmetsp:Transcript_4225/g.6463  ORF Transcript_4225/g.6463 Transcript_4225/m.6463 type:complete len:248 (+) Transcript_4225:758-1501(+)